MFALGIVLVPVGVYLEVVGLLMLHTVLLAIGLVVMPASVVWLNSGNCLFWNHCCRCVYLLDPV